MTPTPHTGLALRISLLALAHGGILQGLVDLSACPCISSMAILCVRVSAINL